MQLIVGLGNPGSNYARNRHNIGFMAVDAIHRGHNGGPWRNRFQAECADVNIAGEKCLLMKPTTFMNESGRAVGEAMRFFKVALDDIVVLHDELDLAPGKLRVKTGGGHAGHNGLKSISAHCGNDYRRVRIGIGHPGQKHLVHSWVLSDFAKADAAWLEPLLDAMDRTAAHLADGDDARFQSEVARLTQPVGEEKKSTKKLKGGGGKPTPNMPDSEPESGHPKRRSPPGAGKWDMVERTNRSLDQGESAEPATKPKSQQAASKQSVGKTGTALGDKLANWIKGRGNTSTKDDGE